MRDQIASFINVSVAFGDITVLENITLEINKGDYVGIIGPNGSGKTTLVKAMLGILKPTQGNIFLFGENISNFRDWKKVSYVSQKPGSDLISNFPITALEVVMMEDVSKQDAFRALEMVEMRDRSSSLLSQLSGGQQQRVFIARALVKRPLLLVLDEPTAGVDQQSQEDFYKLLKNLNQKHDITLILVSHDIDVVSHEVTHLLCVNKTIVCHGRPKEIINKELVEKVYGHELKMVTHGH